MCISLCIRLPPHPPACLPACLPALQLMAVLSESLVYCTQGQLRMQALSAWLCFVQLLAQHAPEVLERIAAQAAVVLLPVLEPADTQGNPPPPAAAPAAGAAGEAAAGGGAEAGGQEEVDQAAVQLAAQVLHSIVVEHRELVRAALQNMPPLPSLAVLKEVNAVLIQVGWCCCIKFALAGYV